MFWLGGNHGGGAQLNMLTSLVIELNASTPRPVAGLSRVILQASAGPAASAADLPHTRHSNTNV